MLVSFDRKPSPWTFGYNVAQQGNQHSEDRTLTLAEQFSNVPVGGDLAVRDLLHRRVDCCKPGICLIGTRHRESLPFHRYITCMPCRGAHGVAMLM